MHIKSCPKAAEGPGETENIEEKHQITSYKVRPDTKPVREGSICQAPNKERAVTAVGFRVGGDGFKAI